MTHARLSTSLTVVVAVLLSLSGSAAQAPDSRDRLVPNFDIRLTAPRVAPPPDPDAQASLEELRRDQPGVRTRAHRFGPGVRTLHASGKPLTPPARGTPEEIARRFLGRYHRLLGLEGRDLASLAKTREYRSHNEPVAHVVFGQTVNGLQVHGSQVQFTISQRGEVLSVGNSATSVGELPEPAIGAEDAVRAAISDVRADLAFTLEAIAGPDGIERRTRFGHGPFASDIEARLVVFPMAAGARLAWEVVIEPPGPPQKYEILIDAVSGERLYRRNRVLYAEGTGRVLQSDAMAAANPRRPDPYPFGTQAGQVFGCPPAANHISRSLTAPFRDSATVLSNTGRLQGNNTHVFRGGVGTEGAAATLSANGWQFDFPLQSAEAAESHLFFLSNFLHDFFYDLGFDEAAGNFQESNFGRGGLGGDSLAAVARAAGRNNATFEPKPDGQAPIMSMFLWDGSNCWAEDVDGNGASDLDGDLDADIAIHEFHHGVSHRLNTQWTGIEAEAMGEGGGDFFSYSINGDTTLAEYAYPPSGIRRVNGKTYGDFYCIEFFGIAICEPHDNGEVFANVLWDLRERFRTDNVGGTNAAAIGMTHQLYVDALKLSPPSPTMLDLRDALLQADGIRNPSGDAGGSRNHCRIWEVFAIRGMGAAAQDTTDTGHAAVVEDFTVAPECPALPPPPSVTVAATIATAYEAGMQPGRWRISRSGDTSRALTVYFTVTGTAAAGSDYSALPASIQIPSGAGATDLQVTPTDDTGVEGNETIVLTLTGSVGYQVGNPAAATVTIVSDDVAPDLVVSALTVPAAGAAGGAMSVSATTKNQGTGAAGASTTRFYFSSNTTVDASDTMLGTTTVGALAAGASVVSAVTLAVPAGTPTGTYYVIAQADGSSTVAETSETNNNRSDSIRVGPDLTVSALTAPAVAAGGAAITVTDTTKNTGGGAAPASVTRFYFSTNTTVDASDTLLGSRSVPALDANATSAGSTTVTIPASATTGTFYVVAKSDGPDSLVETIETNNTRSDSTRIGADLNVPALSVSGSLGAGQIVTVSDTTENQGGGSSDASVTRLLLSSDSAVDGGDTPLGSRNVAALAGGTSSAGSTNVTIPAGTATGGYYILAQADAAGTNLETSETNNVKALFVRIGPDLDVSALSVPSIGGAGAPLVVTDTIKNSGGGPAPSSTTRFYLSIDSTLDGGDWFIGSRAVPGLAAGASNAQPATVNLPAGAPADTYWVIAQADGGGSVVETIETNNLGLRTIKVGPDLIESSLSVPASTSAGSTFSATDTVKNQGGGSAAASTTRLFLSTNTTFDAADTPLGARSAGTIAPNGTQSATTTLTMPAGTAAGTYYVLAVSDADNAVPETSETNNARSAKITVN